MGKGKAGEMVRSALRIFGYQLAFGFLGFMFTPALIGSSPALRIPIIGLLIVAAGMLFFMDGSFRGERDCAMSEALDKLARKGGYNESVGETAKRYRRVKGILAALFGALPFVLLALYVAVTAKPYAYTLQDLPGWLTVYLPRAEIGEPLAYLRNVEIAASVTDYVRIAVRFVLFPFVGLFGQLSDDASLMFDRVSPLLALIMPLIAAVGYQFGPRRRAKSVKAIEEAKNKPKKRLKKEAKQRLQKEKKQLI